MAEFEFVKRNITLATSTWMYNKDDFEITEDGNLVIPENLSMAMKRLFGIEIEGKPSKVKSPVLSVTPVGGDSVDDSISLQDGETLVILANGRFYKLTDLVGS